ncbi:putative transcriptional regulator [Sphingomonas vulcanisoli]|uniref:Transcriptional regulator n=1 Tax=Sphingomonas vulcanisoli TaxID=1658060 RepID=A0ABX0TMX6_9SPHN|nr:antitoxin [Sphingomonas vulcanisoli]NIJ06878.1 putative transcriptional regulator [Sphingomonas vulcanisoli]
MNVERGIFEGGETPEQAALADARARASLKDGEGIPHEEVVKWLKTWGTSQAGPPPKEWFE